MEPRTGRVLSLSDLLYCSEANSDASQDGPRSEREDSDYDEELELDFETLVSGNEGRDESNVLHGSLNLRIHRRGDSTREASGNGLCGSPSSSTHSDNIPYQGHPYNSIVAASGIDNTIKIWSPNASVPSVVTGGAAGPETADMLDIMENNQRKLCCNHEAILPFELLERFRLQEFSEGTFHPFECAQS